MPTFSEDELDRLSIIATKDGLNQMVMRTEVDTADAEPLIVGTAFVNIGIDPRVRNLLLASPMLFQHIKRMEQAMTLLEQAGTETNDPALARLGADWALACRMALDWATNGLDTLRNKIEAENRGKRIDDAGS